MWGMYVYLYLAPNLALKPERDFIKVKTPNGGYVHNMSNRTNRMVTKLYIVRNGNYQFG
jgi:hypothetical protein